MLIAVTGSKGAGKSTLLKNIADLYIAQGLAVSGVITERANQSDYNVFFPADKSSIPLATEGRKEEDSTHFNYRIFHFDKGAFKKGNEVIACALSGDCHLFIDEIGTLELEEEGGFSLHLARAALHDRLILGIRKDSFNKICDKWQFKPDLIIDLDELSPLRGYDMIKGLL